MPPRPRRARLALLSGLASPVLAAGFGTLLAHRARLQLAHAIDEGIVPVATELAVRGTAEGPGAVAGPAPEVHPPADAFPPGVAAGGRIPARTALPGNTPPPPNPARAAHGGGAGTP